VQVQSNAYNSGRSDKDKGSTFRPAHGWLNEHLVGSIAADAQQGISIKPQASMRG
jgi:hypothetical protein